jgi:hypothetical protein
MKLFLLGAALIVLASCQQSPAPASDSKPIDVLPLPAATTADSNALTEIAWIDSTQLQMGTITEGQKLTVQYRFRNVGTQPLVIHSVSASCGCTAPEPPKEPIGPGKEGMITAIFDSQGRVGINHKTLTVTSNTKGSATHELHFDVEVKAKN